MALDDFTLSLARGFLVVAVLATAVGGFLGWREVQLEEQIKTSIQTALNGLRGLLPSRQETWMEAEEIRARFAGIVEITRALPALTDAMRPRPRSGIALTVAGLALVAAFALGVTTLFVNRVGRADDSGGSESPSPSVSATEVNGHGGADENGGSATPTTSSDP